MCSGGRHAEFLDRVPNGIRSLKPESSQRIQTGHAIASGVIRGLYDQSQDITCPSLKEAK